MKGAFGISCAIVRNGEAPILNIPRSQPTIIESRKNCVNAMTNMTGAYRAFGSMQSARSQPGWKRVSRVENYPPVRHRKQRKDIGFPDPGWYSSRHNSTETDVS